MIVTVLLGASASAQDAVLTDDAEVSTTTPNTPDGGAQIMRVRGTIDRAFFKFSVDPILFPPGTADASTKGAFIGKAACIALGFAFRG